MSLRIRRLTCRVTVRTGGSGPLLHDSEDPARPSMQFALPNASVQGETTLLEPSQTATEERGTASTNPEPSPRRADPRAVSERVYALMQQEIRLARLRGGRN